MYFGLKIVGYSNVELAEEIPLSGVVAISADDLKVEYLSEMQKEKKGVFIKSISLTSNFC